MRFSWEFVIAIMPAMLEGLTVTVKATFVGFALAAVLGLVLAIARRSNSRVLSGTVRWLAEIVRDTPLLVQLYLLFYVLPRFGLTLSAFLAGVIGLGVHFSTYTSEVYRAGIDSVDRGQWEGAIALNLSRRHTWTSIILPQSIPPIIPALGNYLIGMFKESVVLSAITIPELLRTARVIGQDTYRYFEPFTLVGILFLAVSYPAAMFIRRLEVRYGRK